MNASDLAERLKGFIYSYPTPVRFAGFESDTLRMAQSGWDLSIRQHQEYHHDQIKMQLAVRNTACNMFGVSAPVELPIERMWSMAGNFLQGIERFKFGFDIARVANDIKFMIIPQVATSARAFADSFEPMDPFPQRSEEVSMREFRFFKTLSPSIKDILVTHEMVPELMELILKAQKPVQDEIRKRQQSRSNYEGYTQERHIIKPAHQVQAQIISLCG